MSERKRVIVTDEILRKHGVKVKDAPSRNTEEEHANWRKAPLAPDKPRNRRRLNVTLDPFTIRLARKMENGNLSRAIDRAILHFHECPNVLRKPEKRKPRDLRNMR